MLNMDEIHEEIKSLEKCNRTTYDVCKKLAILYIVRDHYKGNAETGTNNIMRMTTSAEPMKPVL